MRIVTYAATALLGAVAFGSFPPLASAQDYFIPPSQRQGGPAPAAPRAAPRPAPPRPAPAPAASPPVQVTPPAEPDQQQNAASEPQLPPIQLPPAPDVPAIPKGTTPPMPVIGVIGVPEVMRASSAAQQVEKVIGERRDKLAQDAQKEQNAWREMQQALANDRGKLQPDQIRTRERELQDRVTEAQRKFRERNQFINQAAQVGLAQIERTLVRVIQTVAGSRSMNIVLHRAQVALNVNEFDITDEVTGQLNKILPTVLIPTEAGLMPVAGNDSKAPAATAAASTPPAAGTPAPDATAPAVAAPPATAPVAPPKK